MTRTIGVDRARMVGDLHEVCGRKPEAQRVMDLNNNKVGRICGSGSRGCRASCLQDVSKGSLRRIFTGRRSTHKFSHCNEALNNVGLKVT